MEILKTIREQYGFTQQDMATLLGMTREHYSMVETDKRILPPAPAQRFAALLPTFLHTAPLPPMPEQLPESLHEETHRLLLKAHRDLYKAEQDLQACTRALSVTRVFSLFR